MPDLLLRRLIATPNSVVGMLYLDGTFHCFTLEPPKEPDSRGIQCIPAGEYPVSIYHSNRFNRDMPHIDGVAGHSGIEIHWGNYPKDTDMCVLVGESYTATTPDFIGSSRDAFEALFPKLGTGKIRIEDNA